MGLGNVVTSNGPSDSIVLEEESPEEKAVADNITELDRDDDFIDGVVAGLAIGEGSFILNVSRRSGRAVPFTVGTQFKVAMGDYDRETIMLVKKHLGVGQYSTMDRSEYENEADQSQIKVTDISEIRSSVIPFFDRCFGKMPIKSDKQDSYKIWRLVADRNRDGRSVSTEYLAAHTLLAAKAKPMVNQNSGGRSHVSYEEVKEEIESDFPDVVEAHEDKIEEKLSEVVR